MGNLLGGYATLSFAEALAVSTPPSTLYRWMKEHHVRMHPAFAHWRVLHKTAIGLFCNTEYNARLHQCPMEFSAAYHRFLRQQRIPAGTQYDTKAATHIGTVPLTRLPYLYSMCYAAVKNPALFPNVSRATIEKYASVIATRLYNEWAALLDKAKSWKCVMCAEQCLTSVIQEDVQL